MKELILWGIKKGDPNWMQEIITNDKRNFEKAVKEIWDNIPSGFSSYYTTLCDIEQGRVEV
tara:strand:+ start:581 stop:763 length:183 start_codon:yes stop_codon:yes gene_type:complete